MASMHPVLGFRGLPRRGLAGRRVLVGAVVLALGCGADATGPDPEPEPAFRVLLFTRTLGFRHESIAAARTALQTLAEADSFAVDATEDPAVFTGDGLAPYDVIAFINTSGDVLDDAQQSAFQTWLRSGGGFVGVHSAVDTEYDWPWYEDLVGAYFANHPHIQPAVLHVERGDHPSTRHLDATWTRSDEWYDFQRNPRSFVQVLLTIDETTYDRGFMGEDHPMAWFHEFDGGRAWYTALGHTPESYTEPAFVAHLRGGLLWAAGVEE